MNSLKALVLSAALVVAFGCGPAKTDSPGTSGTAGTPASTGKVVKVGLVYDSGGRGDKSFNDSAAAGLERAKKELGAEIQEVESKAPSDYVKNLTAMAEAGNDIVFAVGLSQTTDLAKIAPEYPNVKFAIVDGDDMGAKNVRSLKFKEEEGSFLVGYLAGLMAKSGKIGFVGGMEIPLIKKFEYGFAAGAHLANPAIVILPSKYTGDWMDQGKGKDLASVLFADGADVVYSAAGRAGLGTIKAAKEAGKFAVGVDSDQDDIEPGVVLTSMVKKVDEAVFSTISDVKEDKFTPGAKMYDLKVNGVGVTDFRNTKDKIGAENIKKLEEVKAKIISGEIKVPSTKDEFDAMMATK
ncbi:MAG: BMP family ABC transporter substrate-binding protein [Armatimonadetes bacterium]|nr:BMP family ABC transporter substrate-binding protein [Armatimonadota bacterium]